MAYCVGEVRVHQPVVICVVRARARFGRVGLRVKQSDGKIKVEREGGREDKEGEQLTNDGRRKRVCVAHPHYRHKQDNWRSCFCLEH